MILNPNTGMLEPTRKFAGGSYHALNQDPKSLLKPNSLYCKVLAVLAKSNEPLKPLQITQSLNKIYYSKMPKKKDSVTARLSELYTLGLVDHFDDPCNKSGGFWALKPGIDVSNNELIYRVALKNIESLKTKALPVTRARLLPAPTNKDLLKVI